MSGQTNSVRQFTTMRLKAFEATRRDEGHAAVHAELSITPGRERSRVLNPSRDYGGWSKLIHAKTTQTEAW
jgi:hypothetical protein